MRYQTEVKLRQSTTIIKMIVSVVEAEERKKGRKEGRKE